MSSFLQMRGLWIALALITAAFSAPLLALLRFASDSSLYSHILLVPLASIYLAWSGWERPTAPSPPARWLAAGLAVTGTALLLLGRFFVTLESGAAVEDYLATMTGSYLCFCFSACALFLGRSTLRQLAFPLAFLLFMIPFPTPVLRGLETLLQHGSAVVALLFFKVYGTPVLADGLFFTLPGFRMHVAPECSGIRSSLVLFIVSLVASYLFLRTPWKRALLVLIVLPLALLRNGLRVFVIGQLCVDIGPHMIDSAIHRSGGPVFFGLSLVPLFLLLFLLWRSERKPKVPPDTDLLPPETKTQWVH